MFQAALGAICAVAFLISNTFGESDPKQKRVVGIVQKTGGHTFRLTEGNARQHTFHLAEPASVYLNDRRISFSMIENGRKAEVRYSKQKGQLFATQIDVFPTHNDFRAPTKWRAAVERD